MDNHVDVAEIEDTPHSTAKEPLYSDSFAVDFLDNAGNTVSDQITHLSELVYSVSNLTFKEQALAPRGSATIRVHNTTVGLQGLDQLAKLPNFSIMIQMKDRNDDVVAVRTLHHCRILRVSFTKLERQSVGGHNTTGTELELTFSSFSTAYPDPTEVNDASYDR